MVRDRQYVRHEVVPMEEDMMVEFKGHRSVSMDDENPKHFNPNNLRSEGRTRQSWSKYLAGFVNSGRGGTLYAGILDNGAVAGIALSPYQVEHVRVALETCLAGYRPPCPPHTVRLRFVPVVEEGEEAAAADPATITPELGRLEHRVRGFGYCWCDCQAGASFGRGLLLPYYVIEVEVAASASAATGVPATYHKAEDGEVYIRRHATTQLYTAMELEEMRRVLALSV